MYLISFIKTVMNENKKSLAILLIVLLCAALVASVVFLYHINYREKTVTVYTTLPICGIIEKVYSDDYYLNIQLDSWFQEENKLPSDVILVRCTKSVFEKVTTGNGYVGISVEIILPTDSAQEDIGMLILENKIGYFTITSVTTSENKSIS